MPVAERVDFLLMLIFGLASSLHCVTMCGPLIAVASAPLAESRRNGARPVFRLTLWQLAYHLGRGISYVSIGAVLGLIGTTLIQVSGARVVGAVLQLGIGLFIAGLGIWQLWGQARGAASFPSGGRLSRLLRRWVTSGHAWGMLVLGLVTGFLPCGVLYAAFARALAVPSPAHGALLLLAFWLGTVPLLFMVGFASGHLFRLAGRFTPLLLCCAMLATGGWLGVKGARHLFATQAHGAAATMQQHGP